LKRQLSVPEIRKGLSEKAVRSGGAYPYGDMGRRDNPLYRQDLAKIGRGQLPFQGLNVPAKPKPHASVYPRFHPLLAVANPILPFTEPGAISSAPPCDEPKTPI